MTPPRRRLRALRLLGRAISWPDVAPPPDARTWHEVKALAREHGLLGALHRAAPGDDEVTAAHRRTAGRNLVARRQLRDIAAALAGAGVDVLVFKGSQYLVDGTVADLGSRTMADLDIAVPAQQRDAAAEVLGRLGYHAAPGDPFEHPHETLYLGPPGTVVPVELHVELGSPPIPAAVPAEAVWRRAVRLEAAGVEVRGLAIDDALVHHVLHAQVQDLNHAVAGLPLRQLHTFSLLARRPEPPWSSVTATLEAAGFGAAWRSYVALGAWVFAVDAAVPGRDAWRAGIDRTAALASFGAGEWPSDVLRNLRFALGAEYLDATYGLGGDRRRLPAARVRHLWRTARTSGRGAVGAALHRRR